MPKKPAALRLVSDDVLALTPEAGQRIAVAAGEVQAAQRRFEQLCNVLLAQAGRDSSKPWQFTQRNGQYVLVLVGAAPKPAEPPVSEEKGG